MKPAFAAILLILAACGPTTFEAIDLPCEDARRSVAHGARPRPTQSVDTIQPGEALPVLRLIRIDRTADELADRAMAYACFVAGDDLRASDALLAWAEEAVATTDDDVAERPFDRADLIVSYDARVDDLQVRYDYDLTAPATSDFDGNGLDDGIGRDAALELVADIYADLAADGLVDLAVDLTMPGTEGSLVVADADFQHKFTVNYGFAFYHQFGGFPVWGSDVWIGATAQGRLFGVSVRDQNVTSVDTHAAAIDEAELDSRYDQLASQYAPASDSLLSITPDSTSIAYFRWYDEATRDVEPRLVKSFIFKLPDGRLPEDFGEDDVNVAALSPLRLDASLDFAP